ncbi:hypothetical protein KZ829_34650 [Actinoplanes hulinensis]|uniref:DUF4190 domain-containing protein n=1 Tax=Actinoplanes hulinensis TaxID=1144547 RepID=A0ABS7BCV4_9ACTN|nr:hypothetical protein [Actinoplanes hulinensis]MBW6438883.1 hypothetical protein [Actinoplanes hulinensis]
MRIPTFPRQSTDEETATGRTPVTPRRDDGATTTTLPPVRSETERARTISEPVAVAVPSPAPRARAGFLATLGLVLSVAGAMLVLSGPLLGYGIGVAAVALIISLAGVFATRKRHVAGKTSALIGMVLSIGAIVLGVLALTGQVWWLGTGTDSATELRTWLDTQFENRF